MLQMGKLLRQLRKQQKMTQKELAAGIVSEAVMSRIENGVVEPDFHILYELFHRLGNSLKPFEIIVSNREYEELKSNGEAAGGQAVVIAEGEYFKDIRESMGLSQEEFSSDVYARETISNIEHGRTPQRKKMQNVLEKQGTVFEKYYGYVAATEYEVYEWVEEYQVLAETGEEAAEEIFRKIKERLDCTLPVNRQFLESCALIAKRKAGDITVGEELAGIEKCLRYTMPEYDGMVYRIPRRQEIIILEEIAWCLEALQRTEAAQVLATVLSEKNRKKLKLS